MVRGHFAAVHNTGHVTYHFNTSGNSQWEEAGKRLASYQPEKTRELLYFGPPLAITQTEIATSYYPVEHHTPNFTRKYISFSSSETIIKTE